jgi:hypothetical protein
MEINIENLKQQFSEIQTATPSNISLIYEALEYLQIPYKKTSCKRCRQDLLNIVKEELGLIESAAEESDFNAHNCGWRYIVNRPVFWGGYRIDQDTPEDVVEKFVQKHPKGYFERIPCPEETEKAETETETLGEFEGHTLVPHPDII